MKSLRLKKRLDGFTLPELIAGAAVSSIIVGAAFAISTAIQRSAKDDVYSMAQTARIDSVLEHIVDELKQGQKILTSQAELPSGCSNGGGAMFMGFLLPAQAYGKGDYSTTTTSTGVFTRAELNKVLCPIVIGLRSPIGDEKGPYVLYRYGPGIDAKGFYQDTSRVAASAIPLLDGISNGIKNGSRQCESGWTRLQLRGLEACVDQYRKAGQISISKEISRSSGSRSAITKRSAAGTALALDSALIPVVDGSSGGTGIGGSTCYLGQCGACDGTSFLIDNSGSMWGRRMAKAKSELMSAIAKCGDGARINVLYFNSRYGRYSSQNVALSSSSRAQINSFISRINAGGGTNPWDALNSLMQNQDVKRVVVLTDGGTRTSGSCIAGGYGYYADCYAKYNATRRALNPVKIDSVALDTSCGNWLGSISSKTGGTCTSARS